MFKVGDTVEISSPGKWSGKFNNVHGLHKILKIKPTVVGGQAGFAYVLSGITASHPFSEDIYWWEGFLNKAKDQRNLPEWF
jgi:hypothetical protein